MEKILLVGDVHFSQYSSILRGHGETHSLRLENLIKSVNWVEELATQFSVTKIIYLGDFFDSESLNSAEISALKSIKWADKIERVFIVGNHELGQKSYNSANALPWPVINKPIILNNILYLPYIPESTREPLATYIGDEKVDIICSHNDIKGVQMGKILTQSGFSKDEIEESGAWFFNGHLHNGTQLSDKIFNVGVLTGQDFKEDCTKYLHQVFIFEDGKIQKIENPHALKFKKCSLNEARRLVEKGLENLVLSIDCDSDKVEEARKIQEKCLASKLNILYKEVKVGEDPEVSSSVNHVEKFTNAVYTKFGRTSVVVKVLEGICEVQKN